MSRFKEWFEQRKLNEGKKKGKKKGLKYALNIEGEPTEIEEGFDDMRDTMCRNCHKWTHRLTPGGKGTVFCNDYCKKSYEDKR